MAFSAGSGSCSGSGVSAVPDCEFGFMAELVLLIG